MLGGDASYLSADGRRESHKRRRLSERRRIFGRLGFTGGAEDSSLLMSDSEDRLTRLLRQPISNIGHGNKLHHYSGNNYTSQALGRGGRHLNERSDSTLNHHQTGDYQAAPGSKISMKIQFHITVAPDNEPLILDPYATASDSLAGSSLFATTQEPKDSLAATNESFNDCAHEGEKSPPTAQDKDTSGVTAFSRQRASISSIGEQINEKLLSRQSTLSTRRRKQLLAMHNQSALDNNNNATSSDHHKRQTDVCLNGRFRSDSATNGAESLAGPLMGGQTALGRESGARSSTISGGMQDEATMRFLARHQTAGAGRPTVAPSVSSLTNTANNHLTSAGSTSSSSGNQREHIYFKRDGQRFGHEFTLKLAVDKSYRCLLKVRPLIPLQAISIQGHHVAFVDCSTNPGAHLSSSAPASTGSLNNSLQSINKASLQANQRTGFMLDGHARARAGHQMYGNQQHSTSISSSNSTTSSSCGAHTCNQTNRNQATAPAATRHYTQINHPNRLSHAPTTLAISLAERRLSSALSHSTTPSPLIDSQLAGALEAGGAINHQMTSGRQLQQFLLKQHQHQQMMRHFAASHCSPSGSHLGGQSFYMFDWSAGRFEVNKNKARTQVQTVLKFKNGQILSLPLQVKFYQPESRQHLNWGSQLHFIDYDCHIDSMGQIQLEKIQYY